MVFCAAVTSSHPSVSQTSPIQASKPTVPGGLLTAPGPQALSLPLHSPVLLLAQTVALALRPSRFPEALPASGCTHAPCKNPSRALVVLCQVGVPPPWTVAP